MKCKHCDYLSRDKDALQSHENAHVKCQKCHSTFDEQLQLIEHMKTHALKKCNICSQEVRVVDFPAHKKSHANIAKFRQKINDPKLKK